MGKYLALGHGAGTSLRSVSTPRPRAKYFPIRPSHLVNKYIVFKLYEPSVFEISHSRQFSNSSVRHLKRLYISWKKFLK